MALPCDRLNRPVDPFEVAGRLLRSRDSRRSLSSGHRSGTRGSSRSCAPRSRRWRSACRSGTRLAEPVVDAIRPARPSRLLAQLEPARELVVDRGRQPLDLLGRASSRSAYGESFAAGGSRSPTRGRSRRSRAGRGAASAVAAIRRPGSRRAAPRRARAPPARGGPSSASAASGVSSQTPARFFEPASVRISSPPSSKRSRNAGVLGPSRRRGGTAAARRSSGARAGRARRPRSGTAAASPGARPREAPALERRQRRVERLQRRDVRRAGFLDRERRDGLVELAPPRLHLGQLRHVDLSHG